MIKIRRHTGIHSQADKKKCYNFREVFQQLSGTDYFIHSLERYMDYLDYTQNSLKL